VREKGEKRGERSEKEEGNERTRGKSRKVVANHPGVSKGKF